MDYSDFCIITFASGEPYYSESLVLKKQCKELGLNFKLYNLRWLKTTNFYKENKELLSCKKTGYCSWKPYIILDALKYYKKVLYLDSSTLIHKSIYKIINKRNAIFSTSTALKNLYYTKPETFSITGLNTNKYKNGNQFWAGNILANRKGIKFLLEWLKYCEIKNCISDDYNEILPSNFSYHLYDQSIYSLLYKKYRYESNNDNCIYNENGECLDYYFADTREFGHLSAIKETFGNDPIINQQKLIKKFMKNYKYNSSCCYNPERVNL